MRRASLLSPLVLLGVLAGCLPFGPTSPIVVLPPQPESLESRPGGVGSLDSVRYVIHISVDGLRPDAITRQAPEARPGFTRLRLEGASTYNARTDVDVRKTLPNHSAQLTGRGVFGDDGHQWIVNVDPAPGATLHSNKGSYIASVFDVAHDAGLRTGAWVSKSKFSLFDVSYNEQNGAPDETGEDNGRDKIDQFVYNPDTALLTDAMLGDLRDQPYRYAFIHLRDPDASGHINGWSVRAGSRYLRAVRRVDAQIVKIIDFVESDARYAGRTAIIVTADHGGDGRTHAPEKVLNYTIPFFVWGPGVPATDLYSLNAGIRANPGTENIGYDAVIQPIRNGEAANLALQLLGLDPVPGSFINRAAPLRLGVENGRAIAPDGPAEPLAPEADVEEMPPVPDEPSRLRIDESEIFDVMEEMPQLIGGLEALQAQLSYPSEALEAGIEGRVVVQMIIDKEGVPLQLDCVRGPEPLCDAAMRAVRASSFVPGRQRGKAVYARYNLPVAFKLR